MHEDEHARRYASYSNSELRKKLEDVRSGKLQDLGPEHCARLVKAYEEELHNREASRARQSRASMQFMQQGGHSLQGQRQAAAIQAQQHGQAQGGKLRLNAFQRLPPYTAPSNTAKHETEGKSMTSIKPQATKEAFNKVCHKELGQRAFEAKGEALDGHSQRKISDCIKPRVTKEAFNKVCHKELGQRAFETKGEALDAYSQRRISDWVSKVPARGEGGGAKCSQCGSVTAKGALQEHVLMDGESTGRMCSACWGKLYPCHTSSSLPVSPVSDTSQEGGLGRRKTRPVKEARLQPGQTPDCALDVSDGDDERRASHAQAGPAGRSNQRWKSLRQTQLRRWEGRSVLYGSGGNAELLQVEDLRRLQPTEFLNDTVLEFYIKYMQRPEALAPQEQKRFHFCSTFFFRKLRQALAEQRKEKDGTTLKNVGRWNKEVDIFEKEYCFVPVNDSLHWSLAVICFPGAKSSGDASQPCILHLDSVSQAGGGHDTALVGNTLRRYLNAEWANRVEACPEVGKRSFTATACPAIRVAVPQQCNEYDCGLFLLFNMENFIHEAPGVLRHTDLESRRLFGPRWFKPEAASDLRFKIRKLIEDLFEKQEEDELQASKAGAAGPFHHAVDKQVAETEQADNSEREEPLLLRKHKMPVEPDTPNAAELPNQERYAPLRLHPKKPPDATKDHLTGIRDCTEEGRIAPPVAGRPTLDEPGLPSNDRHAEDEAVAVGASAPTSPSGAKAAAEVVDLDCSQSESELERQGPLVGREGHSGLLEGKRKAVVKNTADLRGRECNVGRESDCDMWEDVHSPEQLSQDPNVVCDSPVEERPGRAAIEQVASQPDARCGRENVQIDCQQLEGNSNKRQKVAATEERTLDDSDSEVVEVTDRIGRDVSKQKSKVCLEKDVAGASSKSFSAQRPRANTSLSNREVHAMGEARRRSGVFELGRDNRDHRATYRSLDDIYARSNKQR